MNAGFRAVSATAPGESGMGKARCELNRARRGLKYSKILNFKPRLPEIEDISEAKRKMKMSHVALDAV